MNRPPEFEVVGMTEKVKGDARIEINKIYCMDCVEGLMSLESDSVDCIIIDPPYSSGARQTNQLRAKKGMNRSEKWANKWFGTDNLSTAGFMFFMRGLMMLAFQKLRQNSHAYIFIDWRNYPLLVNVLESCGWRINDMIVWDKQHFGMGYQYRNQHELIIFCSKGEPRPCHLHNIGNVIRCKRIAGEHPTEKPLELIEKFILMSSKEGDLIVDFFSGSGTTAVACKKLNRCFIGFEINPAYIKIAEDRLRSVSAQSKLSELAG
jgi:site-specific DNA-methyltransferase (adenine-specific)